MKLQTLLTTSLALAASASPLHAISKRQTPDTATTPSSSRPYRWAAGATTYYSIHSSCNATERNQIESGLDDMIVLAEHALEHILRYGNDTVFVKYFGSAATAEPIGWFDKVVRGDRGGMLFRCDDPDGNCHQEGWGGHWRGSNATLETVICPLSYSTRLPLSTLCAFGYTVAGKEPNTYWGSDLMHRVYHVPRIGEGIVLHYANEFEPSIELAKTDPSEAVRNTDSLLYYALETYAYDVAVPGVGCAGSVPVGNVTRKA